MRKPLIGITGSMLMSPVGETGLVVPRNFANNAYVQGVIMGGGVPVIVPLLENLELVTPALELCDGFLLPGGIDICPEFYSEEPHEKLGPVSRELDEFNFHVINYAFDHHKPILGICRGEQVLNVALGGSLYQDLGECPSATLKHPQTEGRSVATHDVFVTPETRLHRILESRLTGENKITVNSMHHQAVKVPGEKIILTAHATDGVIEAFETPDGLVVAVQWHPEELLGTVPVMVNLFSDLVERAGENRA